jgi:hypothetical protein
MNTSTTLFTTLIKEHGFEYSKTRAVKEKKSVYEIIWGRTTTGDNSIQTLAIEYMFDMDTFLVFCKINCPDYEITERDTIMGIGLYFSEIAEWVMVFGNTHYLDLANFLYKNRGTITGIVYNI